MDLVLLNEDGQPSRRLSLSPRLAKGFGLLFLFFVVFSSVMTWSFLHYRTQKSHAFDASLAALQHERARLVSKVGALEGTIARIERFTEKLEASVGVETGKLQMGVGPISEQENLGEFLTQVSQLPKLSSKTMAQDWRQGKFDEGFYDKFSARLDELSTFASDLEIRVNEVYEANENTLSFWASSPSLWPVKGWLTSGFGYRSSPWGRGHRMHKGVDIAAPIGTIVQAPSDGVITYARRKGGYGLTVVIDHGYGIKTLYGHNSRLFVAEGDRIRRGQTIAAVGNTGASTGPHLHYEVHVDGIPTDPMNFIVE